MRLNFILPNVPSVTITLFNDQKDHDQVDQAVLNGSKRDAVRLHQDVAERRFNDDIESFHRERKLKDFRKTRIVPVN